MIVLRKIRSAWRLLTQPRGLRECAAAAGKNWRLWRVCRSGGRPFVYSTRSGVRFACLPWSATSLDLFVSRPEYEQAEADVCRRWLRPGDCCIDGGANVGLFSALLAEAVGSSGTVVSVEPAPQTVEYLRAAMDCLGLSQVLVEPVCLSDRPGVVEFAIALGDASDVVASMKVNELLTEFRTINVAAATLDELIVRHELGSRLALVKLDLEGAEPLALAGGQLLFDPLRLPLFLVEVNKAPLAAFGFDWSDVLRFFPLDAFELYHVQRSRSDVTPQFRPGIPYLLPDPACHEWPWYSNLIAVPRQGMYACRRQEIAKLLAGG